MKEPLESQDRTGEELRRADTEDAEDGLGASEDANPADPNDETPREEDGQGEGSPGGDEPS